MPELSELAEWVGVEVIDVEGEAVLRYRQKDGTWCEREQRATAEEAALYDALRGMVATQANSAHALLLKAVAEAAGLGDETRPMRVLKRISLEREKSERWQAIADKNHDIIQDLRRQLTDAQNLPRLTPKGGDRNEFARQVRRTAHAVYQGEAEPQYLRGVVEMANTVLRLLGDEEITRNGNLGFVLETPTEQAVWVQAVEQLKADRYRAHPETTRAHDRNRGEQNAFAMVLQLLRTGKVVLS